MPGKKRKCLREITNTKEDKEIEYGYVVEDEEIMELDILSEGEEIDEDNDCKDVDREDNKCKDYEGNDNDEYEESMNKKNINKKIFSIENDDSFINTVYKSKDSTEDSDIEFIECIQSLDSDNIVERADKFMSDGDKIVREDKIIRSDRIINLDQEDKIVSEDEIEILKTNTKKYDSINNISDSINENKISNYEDDFYSFEVDEEDFFASSYQEVLTPQLYYLRNVFKLEKFRINQEPIIKSVLEKKNVFVLMPTGGGKSLCYQIPALIDTGVTIVISPLLSLVHDQISNLLHNNILALPFNSTLNTVEKRMVLENLTMGIIKIFYVTPEILCSNYTLENKLKELMRLNKLSRFVIDEAHCVSQWGHDFRPDYIEIKKIREMYPKVPIVALTATATPKVELDILTNLQILDSVVYKQSFNRENLKYYVKPKTKSVEIDIVTFILTHYNNECGIIYCTSKKECEMISDKLNKHLKTAFYHAGLTKKERMSVQSMWNQNKFKIIVATIAFGMGIDKKDVRFVIHYSLPKSLEGYYQETGRAGRDGKESVCILYYSYGDKKIIDYMINMNKDAEQKKRQRDELRDVIRFCENKVDCRRTLILTYFNEKFHSDMCNKGCDNCMTRNIKVNTKDYKKEAKEISELVRTNKLSIHQVIDVYRGIGTKKVDSTYAGRGKNMKRIEVERIVTQMVVRGYFEERSEINGMGYSWSYLVFKKEVYGFELHEEIDKDDFFNKKSTKSSTSLENEDIKIVKKKPDTKRTKKN